MLHLPPCTVVVVVIVDVVVLICVHVCQHDNPITEVHISCEVSFKGCLGNHLMTQIDCTVFYMI